MSEVMIRIGKTPLETHVFLDGKEIDGIVRVETVIDATDNAGSRAILYLHPESVEVVANEFHMATTCPCCGLASLHKCEIPRIEGSDG